MPISAGQEADLYRIALGVTYILLDRAEVDFPSTTRAHPSDWVVVSRNVRPPLRDGDNQFFPFKVPWHLWQNLVVPVLKEGGVSTLGWMDTLQKVLLALRVGVDPSLVESSTLQEESIFLRGPFPGVTSPYPTVDTQLAWDEGHPRLVYPEVE